MTNKKDQRKEVKTGDFVRIYEIIKCEKSGKDKKDRIQIFEGIVIAKRLKNSPSSTITVRKISQGIGIEKIYPLYSPLIQKIEILKRYKVRKSKAYYLRNYKKRLKSVK